jgi:hypothetical protein
VSPEYNTKLYLLILNTKKKYTKYPMSFKLSTNIRASGMSPKNIIKMTSSIISSPVAHKTRKPTKTHIIIRTKLIKAEEEAST